MRHLTALAFTSILVSASGLLNAWSATYYAAIDVPARLGLVDVTPNSIVRSSTATYSLEINLPADLEIASLYRQANGAWLFSPAQPIEVGLAEVEPRDLVGYDGSTFSVVLDGASAGIPDYARIDAVFVSGGGDPILSFDVPVSLGGTEYGQSDLVRYSGGAGFSHFWDAMGAGVPSSSNLVGADIDESGTQVITFDIPTTLSGSDYMPGQLVFWDGIAFGNYFTDPAWPRSVQLRGVSFVPSAPSGAVPDGSASPGTPLVLTHGLGGDIILTWDESCVAGDSDFEIYEGVLGSPNSHTKILCTTGGATTQTVTPSASATYYLVVPRNQVKEGSYGLRSSFVERPQGLTACLPREIAICQ